MKTGGRQIGNSWQDTTVEGGGDRACFLAGTLFCAAAALLGCLVCDSSYRVESLKLGKNTSEWLAARLYVPTNRKTPLPGVLLCHGVNNSKETMQPLALAFAHAGFAVLAFDFGGHGESYPRPVSDEGNMADLDRALGALADHPAVDGRRLVLVGHSMGVRAAVPVAGRRDNVRAVVALGMEVFASPSEPANLLIAAGLYDQFFSPKALLDGLRASTGRPDARADVLYGSFDAGTARLLAFSPCVDHVVASFDPTLIARSVSWSQQALGANGDHYSAWPFGLLVVERVSLFVGAMLIVLALIHLSLGRIEARWRNQRRFRYALSLIGATLALLPLALDRWLGVAYLSADLCLFLLVVLMLTNYLLQAQIGWQLEWSSSLGVALARGLRPLGFVAVAWIASVLICRVAHVAGSWWALGSVPVFIAQMATFLPYHWFLKLRPLLFVHYSESATASWPLFLLVVVEVCFPGRVLYIGQQVAQTVLDRLRVWRRPIGGKPATVSNSPSLHWGRLTALLMLLAALTAQLVRQFSQLDEGMILTLAVIAARMLLLPLAFLFLLVNAWPAQQDDSQ